MITAIELENFKAFGIRQKIRFGRITVLVGGNSSGKTSLLQAILLLKQSLEMRSPYHYGTQHARITLNGPYVQFPSFETLAFANDIDKRCRIGVTFNPQLSEIDTWLPGPPRSWPSIASAKIAVTLTKTDNGASVNRVEYAPALGEPWDVNGFGEFEKGNSPTPFIDFLTFCARESPKQNLGIDERPAMPQQLQALLRLLSNGSRRLELSRWLPDTLTHTACQPYWAALLPNDETEEYEMRVEDDIEDGRLADPVIPRLQQSWEGLMQHFYHLLDHLKYLGPVRAHPVRSQPLTAPDQLSHDITGVSTFSQLALFHGTSNVEQNTAVDKLNHWAQACELPYSFDPQEVGDPVLGRSVVLRVRDRRTNLGAC